MCGYAGERIAEVRDHLRTHSKRAAYCLDLSGVRVDVLRDNLEGTDVVLLMLNSHEAFEQAHTGRCQIVRAYAGERLE